MAATAWWWSVSQRPSSVSATDKRWSALGPCSNHKTDARFGWLKAKTSDHPRYAAGWKVVRAEILLWL